MELMRLQYEPVLSERKLCKNGFRVALKGAVEFWPLTSLAGKHIHGKPLLRLEHLHNVISKVRERYLPLRIRLAELRPAIFCLHGERVPLEMLLRVWHPIRRCVDLSR